MLPAESHEPTFPTPLGPDDGELLTNDPAGCGEMSVSPDNPRIPETVTISISGAPVSNTTIPVRIVPGVLIGDRWYSLWETVVRNLRAEWEEFPHDPDNPSPDLPAHLDDPSDGHIDTTVSLDELTDSDLVVIPEVLVDIGADGSGTVVFEFPAELNGGTYVEDIIFIYLLTSAWVAVCGADDSVTSVADVRPGRDSGNFTLSLDPENLGTVVVSDYGDTLALAAIVAPMLPDLSPADSIWMHMYAGIGRSGGAFSSLVDFGSSPPTEGAWVALHHFYDLPPGRYALGMLGIDGVLEPPEPQPQSEPQKPTNDGALETRSALVTAVVSGLLRLYGHGADRGTAGPFAEFSPANHDQYGPFAHLVKAEWVLIVADDQSLSLERADGSDRSFAPAPPPPPPPPTLAETGVSPIMPAMVVALFASLAGLALLGGAILIGRRKLTATR